MSSTKLNESKQVCLRLREVELAKGWVQIVPNLNIRVNSFNSCHSCSIDEACQ